MKFKYTHLVVLLAVYLLVQCMPPTPEPVITTINRNFEDPVQKKIAYYQDNQFADSLLPYFRHKDPTYRLAAATAFSSIEKESILDSLAILLKDPIAEVRTAAAHAIGQQGALRGERFLTGAFEQYDSLGQYKRSNGAILEAVGKCASRDFLTALSGISTYSAKDTALLEGQARGIYNYSIRKITIPAGTSKMLEFVNNNNFPNSVRLMASNYLARAAGIKITDNVEALSQTFESEKDPNIRMALALALGKNNQPRALQALSNQLAIEQDYRVKCNIIRALKKFEYDAVKTPILNALDDERLPVAQTAAQFFITNGVPQEARLYRQKSKENYHWSVQLALNEAANKYLPTYMTNTKAAINAELKSRLPLSTNPYERAETIRALGAYGWNYRFLQNQLPLLQTVVEKTALTESLAKITSDLDFYKIFGAGALKVSREIGNHFIQVIRSGDVGRMSVAAKALRNENIDFKTLFLDSLPVIENAQQLLDLPKSIETYIDLQHTIDYFNGRKLSTPKKVAHNNTIDTTLLSKINGKPTASITTNKGNIRIRLKPLEAPGSVLNFIKLAESDFYVNKKFHRVAPNFVIQAGCPRGDGYGSLDYTIRSELPIGHYDGEGYLGMASAGKHTEGTQFFITHSPSPHLDGKYTIFGRVSDGMDIVHSIEVGDSIRQISISY